ncbi:ATPase inhibitor mai-2, mitochondrial [Melipona quadrifasciata]|uniref:Regulatory protein zeste n=1 Tax=Melipona quadrifasciata TaxID=166423 RepID=A0A0N0BFH9_9HYME|nr:ATPase inhibitor mai-2, mitochondrial [Melipona quadrifasciata]
MCSNSTTVLLKKRERTQNWVPEEKNTLFSLIKEHVNAIENKKIDAAASAMKTFAWQQVYSAFRGRFSTDRDITRIREQWRRMKGQARMEMYTFAEKVKTLGPEEAAKCRPSNLSIEVWKLMEKARKNDGDEDRSDENGRESPENSSLQTFLNKLTASTTEIATVNEIKVEADSDEYNTEDENNQHEVFKKKSDVPQRKRSRISESEPVDLAEQRTNPMTHNDGVSLPNVKERNDRIGDEQVESVQKATWMFELAQREHELKLRMLNIELERAELQKQTAINELKTSEIKRQLIQNQATEYYSQIRMVGERGAGAGKGGGGGGAIREAGGSFGKMEAAHEDQYFYNLQKEQLQKLKEDLHDEISFHEEQIKRHQEAINRHKQRITEMDEK